MLTSVSHWHLPSLLVANLKLTLSKSCKQPDFNCYILQAHKFVLPQVMMKINALDFQQVNLRVCKLLNRWTVRSSVWSRYFDDIIPFLWNDSRTIFPFPFPVGVGVMHRWLLFKSIMLQFYMHCFLNLLCSSNWPMLVFLIICKFLKIVYWICYVVDSNST